MVGLGNPGRDYEGTRHNVGAETVLRLAGRHGARMARDRSTRSLVAKVSLSDRVTTLAIPQTWMNECGIAVRSLRNRYLGSDPASEDAGRARGASDLQIEGLLVIHDELDLPVGTVKVKLGGGIAGHNGLRSITSHLHGTGFARIRVGIGKPPHPERGAEYVLARPAARELEGLQRAEEDAADAVEVLASEGLAAAMTKFNASGR